MPRTAEANDRYSNPDNDPRGPWTSGGLDVKTYNSECDYTIKTPSGRLVNPPGNSCWRFTKSKLKELIKDNRIWFGENGGNVPRLKRFLNEVKQGITCLTIWEYKDVGHNQEGAQELNNLLGRGHKFNSPKVVRLLLRILQISSKYDTTILDYFAGSGTTAHAVINLNREDEGNRKYILVEMGEYFDTVLKPRIQKVVYDDTWKDGKPVRKEQPDLGEKGNTGGSSHMFKYMKLESYEDTLNNLKVHTEGEYTKLKQLGMEGFVFREGFMLDYYLDYETGGAKMSTEVFSDPSAYELQIATGTVGETKPVHVDLIETFNYLIGLTVEHKWKAKGCVFIEGIDSEENKVLIVWRKVGEVSNSALSDIFKKQEIKTRDREFDIIYVNGDNNLENIRFEEEKWKVRLIEHEFRARMFSGTE